ncbi:MAG: hypothetical protein M5U15_05265 [Kiritimatiellae bacterium]|nr:hypothetical protein [Kiritimatiellia bacterium]
MNKRVTASILLLSAIIFGCGNAGTPLMWASIIHLFIGNALIGILEGLLIAQVFKLHRGKSIGVLVVANYISTWAGGITLTFFSSRLSIDLYSGRWFIPLAALLFLALTILLEWPLITLLFKGHARNWRQGFKASIIAQCASYLLIAGWYLLASGFDLYTTAKVTSAKSFIVNSNAIVYFIGQDGQAYKQGLKNNHPALLERINSTNKNDRLALIPSSEQGYLDLVARLETGHRSSITNLLLRAITTNAAVGGGGWTKPINDYTDGNWGNFGSAADLRTSTDREWEVRTGFWAIEGINLKNTNTGKRIHLSVETPFLQWYARNATVLPGDEVVFQLGQQICLFNREKRLIVKLASGRGPVVIIE